MSEPTTPTGKRLAHEHYTDGDIRVTCEDIDDILAIEREAAKAERERMDARKVVRCDQMCEALQDPETLDEYKAAWLHWRDHGHLSGCSHAC